MTLATRTVETTAGLCDRLDLDECGSGRRIELLERCEEPLCPVHATTFSALPAE